jgi:hypothetical protein
VVHFGVVGCGTKWYFVLWQRFTYLFAAWWVMVMMIDDAWSLISLFGILNFDLGGSWWKRGRDSFLENSG